MIDTLSTRFAALLTRAKAFANPPVPMATEADLARIDAAMYEGRSAEPLEVATSPWLTVLGQPLTKQEQLDLAINRLLAFVNHGWRAMPRAA
jgi:hypothetical protein